MGKLKNPIELETAFDTYSLHELLGEGGAGRVYGGVDAAGRPVAVKILTNQTRDKRQRFKNEIGFLERNTHPNIVKVVDHGVSTVQGLLGPFYVMPKFVGSLRTKVGALEPESVIPIFSQILDGVEAAHLVKVTHRDLKPENILMDSKGTAAVADFGIARFTEEQLHTHISTAPTQRLANFQYAAPEQRTTGRPVGESADIYALGLMLNELFTGVVPHGTEYRKIELISAAHGYLDPIVAQMIRQDPGRRPQSIAAVKAEIQKYHSEAVSLQKLRELDNTVIPAGEVSDPLAHTPPKLIAAEWAQGRLVLTLDRAVNPRWVNALHNMGSYRSLMDAPPQSYQFSGTRVIVNVGEGAAQMALDYFKEWLPMASSRLKYELENEAKREEHERLERLRSEREAEERRLSVNRSLRI